MEIPPISFRLDDYVQAMILAARWDLPIELAVGMCNPIGLRRTTPGWENAQVAHILGPLAP
jgi:hypothetical protein